MKKIYLLFFTLFLLLGNAAISQCTNTSAFGTANAPTTPTPITITTCAFGGEYSTINNCVAGSTYLFAATGGAGNYITIRQGTSGGTVLGFGTSPVSVTCTVSGPLYLHYNTNAACGTDGSCHTGTVACTSCSAPPAIPNDLCTAAINLNCSQTITGTTVGATADAVGTCTTPLGTAPGVWYTFVGNGASTTLSLCGSGYDTKIGVFSGSCAALTCVIGNDDFCGLQSQVTFTSVIGTTYYVLVTGFSTASGTFTLARTCVAPANDLCTGAIALNCTQTVTGNTSAANPDAVASCGGTVLNTAPGVWYTFAGDGFQTTLSLCGSGYDTKIGVFSGTCAALVCVAGNDDFCGLQSQVTFISNIGTTYYVLVTGFGTNSGSFTLARTCVLPPCLPTTITPAAPTVCQNVIQALTASSANPGNPAHFWAPVTELFTDPAATVPYTGTAVATVYAKLSTTRTYTATLPATTCSPTPASVTVTVNPNPDLIIVADPGTTICEGDPTLLTVFNSSGFAPVALTQSSSTTITTGNSVACNAGGLHTDNSYWRAYNLAALALPSALTVTTVTFGIEQAAGGAQPVTVRLYTQNAGPAFPGGTRTLVGTQAASVPNQTNSLFTVTFSTPVVVPNTAVMIVELFTPNGQATGRSFFIGSNAAAQTGTTYLSAPDCGITNPTDIAAIGFPNMHIILNVGGTVGAVGGIATGTFLWSPAAGLSSTTSNPVAASPMNTTTYTVVRTTAQNCTATTQVIITVNKRPTVTTQPVSRANCDGTSATFTVAGTGTSLTYQWQERTTPAGAWNNLTNVAPYSGVTTPTLTVNPVAVSMNGYAYRCVLSGTCAPILTNNISNPAILTVNPLPPVTVTPATGCGGVAGINGLLLTASGADTYTWSPITGLFTNAAATIAYTGGNTATVYAAPTAFTAYTVTGTFTATGCFNSATAFINYTPPAPLVTPSSVTMCLGDPAVKLKASTSTQLSTSSTSGVISVPITDNSATATTNALTISGIPAGATITSMTVALNMVHTYPADMVINLRAPNGQILSLYKHNTNTDNGAASIPTAGFFNAVVSSSAATAFSAVPSPYRYGITAPAGPYRADALNGVTNPGYPVIMDPTGFASNAAAFSSLYSTPNGTYTLAMCDGGPADLGTFQGWTLTVNYLVGVLATPAVWTPAAGLFSDAAATVPYVAGTAVDSVWTRPTPSGVYPYQVTVNSIPAAPLAFANTAPITINGDGNANPYPANVLVSGLPTTGVSVKSVTISGISHTWSEDVDILLQSPSGQNVILISDIAAGGSDYLNNTYTLDDAAPNTMSGTPPPSGTYKPTNAIGQFGPEPDNWPAPGPGTVNQPNPTLSTFTGNMNGTWKLFVFDDAAGDAGTIAGGFSVNFDLGVTPCTSPARTVIVTVNQPVTLNANLPVNQTICTDKVATFTVAVTAGTAPFSYQWQVSTNGGVTYTNISNGGVYSGATTATLTITAPPVSMSGNFYRAVVQGALPCASAISLQRILTVNPLPTIVLTASPYTKLFPGLTTTISSTVSPVAAASYTWLRNGVTVAGATTDKLVVDVDGLGNYSLRVTDINGCTNTSNTVTISDSASGRCFIYPNPTSGKFQVRYYSVANNVLPRSLTIYDAKGDRVLTQMYQIGRPYDRMDVDMRAYGKGLYWVEIGDLNGNRITMCRLVIQ